MIEQVLAFLFQAITMEDGTLMFQMMTEPVLMGVEECLKMAHEINNTPDIPQVIMCMPPIVEPGLPV